MGGGKAFRTVRDARFRKAGRIPGIPPFEVLGMGGSLSPISRKII